MLSPYLSEETVGSLLAAAAGKTTSEVSLLLAARFPQPDVATKMVDLAGNSVCQGAARPLGTVTGGPEATPSPEAPPFELASPEASPESPISDRTHVTPLSPGRYGIEFTFGQQAYEKLAYAHA